MDRAVAARVWRYLRPLAIGLALMYGVFAVIRIVLHTPPQSWVLAGVAVATAASFASVGVVWRRLPSTAPWPYAIGSAFAGLIVANALAHVVVAGHLQQTTHLMLLLLGAGVLLPATRWLLGVVVVTLAGWGLVVALSGPYGSLTHHGTSLGATAFFAVVVHVVLRRATRESERRRLSAEHLQHTLSRAFQAEADARRELESVNEALEQAVQEAEELNQAQTAFLADMSHEIRTPLTSIIGFAEVLGEENPQHPARFAQLIRQSSERLMQTVNSVLDLSKLDRGATEFQPERVDVTDLLEDTVDLFRDQADAADITLRLTTPEQPVTAVLDPSSLNRITSNLIGNAVKFCDSGDTVAVELEPTPDVLVIRVQDDGPGIQPEFRDQLFEPFQRDPALEQEGTGLGLAITRRLVEAMEGDIDVDSAPGEGATFTVALPRPDADDIALP